MFDNNFCADVVNRVREAVDSCMNDSSGDLFEPLVYEEVASVSASLKAGISGVEIDYDHICFAAHLYGITLFPPFVKFMRWCSLHLIGWKNTQMKKVHCLTCGLSLRWG